MAFWSEQSSEAKRNYRFRITLDGAAIWWAKTVTLPSFDVSEVEHNHMDNKYYFPGRVSWSEVSMTLVDPIDPDAAQQLSNLLVKMGYNVPTETSAQTKGTIDKSKNTITVLIEVVDMDGTQAVETWTLNNAFIKAAKFGDLDYSNDELKTVELTLRYDWATHTAADGTDYFKKS
tara:strand:- start:82 stop:606 length:525 start_codon:yes stop_codon:yes gene_type:complete